MCDLLCRLPSQRRTPGPAGGFKPTLRMKRLCARSFSLRPTASLAAQSLVTLLSSPPSRPRVISHIQQFRRCADLDTRARHRKDILLPEEGLRFDCAPVELYPRQERALVSFHSATTGPRGSDDGQNYCGDRISVRPMSAINKQPVIWCVVGRLPGIIHRQRIIEVVDRMLFFSSGPRSSS